MAAYGPEQIGNLLGREVPTDEPGDKMLSPHEHDGFVELMAVERIRCCDALAPADAEIRLDLEEEDVLRILGEERSSKRAHQRERATVDGDSLDPHQEVISEESYESTWFTGFGPFRGGIATLAHVTKKTTVPRATKKSAAAKEPVARRRRPREETRELLLQEAEDLLVERLAEGSDSLNPLAAMRITDVLASINARLVDEPSMTTGAAYQIWESQTAFQDELLDRIMRKVAVPWEVRAREAIAAAMAAGLPLMDVVAAMSAEDSQPRESVELSLAAGLSAFVAPKRIRRAERKANAEYIRVLGGMLEEIIAYAGRRMRPGLTVADIVWSVEALEVGYNLRERSHPELVRRTDAQGMPISVLAFVGMIESMTEQIPARRVSRKI